MWKFDTAYQVGTGHASIKFGDCYEGLLFNDLHLLCYFGEQSYLKTS